MIDLQIDGAIARLILDHPPVNAINRHWIDNLNEALDQIESQGGISVIHISSALKVFSAGADLKMMGDLLDTPAGRDQMIVEVRKMQQVFARLEQASAVTIAEIIGAAMGGGLEMALACDLRVAAENARLGLPEASLGLLPGAGGTQRLPRIAGQAVARRLILGAEVIDGKEAARLGVVQWTHPQNELGAWTEKLVARMGDLPVQAIAANKRCLAAALNPVQDGYELELSETRRLHDVAETQTRVRALLDGHN